MEGSGQTRPVGLSEEGPSRLTPPEGVEGVAGQDVALLAPHSRASVYSPLACATLSWGRGAPTPALSVLPIGLGACGELSLETTSARPQQLSVWLWSCSWSGGALGQERSGCGTGSSLARGHPARTPTEPRPFLKARDRYLDPPPPPGNLVSHTNPHFLAQMLTSCTYPVGDFLEMCSL